MLNELPPEHTLSNLTIIPLFLPSRKLSVVSSRRGNWSSKVVPKTQSYSRLQQVKTPGLFIEEVQSQPLEGLTPVSGDDLAALGPVVPVPLHGAVELRGAPLQLVPECRDQPLEGMTDGDHPEGGLVLLYVLQAEGRGEGEVKHISKDFPLSSQFGGYVSRLKVWLSSLTR